MFSFVFWVLLCWFIVNVIWMWFVLKNQTYQEFLHGLTFVLL